MPHDPDWATNPSPSYYGANLPITAARYTLTIYMNEDDPNTSQVDAVESFAVEFQRALDNDYFLELRYDRIEFTVEREVLSVWTPPAEPLPYIVGVNGETPLRLRRFATEDEAARFIGTLEGAENGIYYLDGPESHTRST